MEAPLHNWKTSLGGILMAMGTIATQAPIPPPYSWIPAVITAVGGALTGLSAKDFNVHSTLNEVEAASTSELVSKPAPEAPKKKP